MNALLKAATTRDTTAMPVWLLIAAVLALVLRIEYAIHEKNHPLVPSKQILWQPVPANEPGKQTKPILYYFSAAWSQRCREFETNAMTDPSIIDYINCNFVPVHIEDQLLEQGKNAPAIQNLENKFGVTSMPAIVVAMPDGMQMDSITGIQSRSYLKRRLIWSVQHSIDVGGCQHFVKGDFISACRLFRSYLNEPDNDPVTARFCRLRLYVALRCLHRDDEAAALLKDALTHERDKLPWPYPVSDGDDRRWQYQLFHYFAGDLKYNEIDKRDEYDYSAYVALVDWSKGDYAACASHLDTALGSCPNKTYWCYQSAQWVASQLPPQYSASLKKKYGY